jgi:hypothetical protein
LVSVVIALAALGWQLRHSGDGLRVRMLPRPRLAVIRQPVAARAGSASGGCPDRPGDDAVAA